MNPRIGMPALRGVCVFLALFAAGCAALPENRGTAGVDALLAARGVAAPRWSAEAANASIPAEPLSMARAVELAFARNPEVRGAYAELGIAEADVLEARQLFDLNLGFSNMGVSGGPGEKVTRSIAVAFADLLMLPARSRLARTEYERRHAAVAGELFSLATRVETAWVEYVSAQQLARLADASAELGETAGELAKRMHAAGNLSAPESADAQAQAREARIDGLRARSAASTARAELATLLGAKVDDAWATEAALPSPPASEPAMESIVEAALRSRLDLAATRTALTAREQALGTARSWRWLGDVEIGYEEEKEPGGGKLAGPTLAIGIPLFHWNRAGVLRAQAELEAARAEQQGLENEVRNEVATAVTNLMTAREIALQYQASVALRAQVASGALENYNFMLADAFVLIGRKREQMEGIGGYLESLAEYWRTRAVLETASGGALPPAESSGKAISLDDLLNGKAEGAPDPHAGHHGL